MDKIKPLAILLLVLLAGLGAGFFAGRASVDQAGRYYLSRIRGYDSLVIDTATGRQWIRRHSSSSGDIVIDMGTPEEPRPVGSLLKAAFEEAQARRKATEEAEARRKAIEEAEKTVKEPPVDPATEREKIAMRFYDERVAYEKEHGSEGMDEQYRYILDHFAGTKAAEMAQKAIDRLGPDTGGNPKGQ